jgi:hypothetical protein
MMVRPYFIALPLLLCALANGEATTVRLDDAGSYALQPNAQMQWRSNLPKGGSSPDTETRVQVQIHINTRDYMGRQGRIYMVLPLDPGPQITATWQTQGRLIPGEVTSGNRGLVFSGPITGPTLDDQLDIRLRSQGDWPAASRRLNVHFELDTQ